jgi:hypothetical protein
VSVLYGIVRRVVLDEPTVMSLDHEKKDWKQNKHAQLYCEESDASERPELEWSQPLNRI